MIDRRDMRRDIDDELSARGSRAAEDCAHALANLPALRCQTKGPNGAGQTGDHATAVKAHLVGVVHCCCCFG